MDLPQLHLIPIKPEHMGFLRQIYCVSRDFEMVHYPWSEEEKTRFLQWQFELQHRHYQTHYKEGNFDLICLEDTKIGRIYVHRQDHDIRLMDITLLREYRNQGIGAGLVAELLAEGCRKGAQVSLHVEPNNPAVRFYHRLGFTVRKTEGAYYYMEWQPEKALIDDRGP